MKRNQLKRARLADDLNKKLAKRPGPLELLESGILKSDTKIVEAIKDGKIAYARTTRTTSTNENGSSSHSPASSYGDFSFSASVNSNSSRSSSQYLDVNSEIANENGSNGSNSPTNYMSIGFESSKIKSSKQTAKSSPFSPAPCSTNNKPAPSNSSQMLAPASTTKKLIFHEYRGPNQKPNKTVSIQPISSKRAPANNKTAQLKPSPQQSIDEALRKSNSFTNSVTALSKTLAPASVESSMQLDDDSTLITSDDSGYQKCLEQQEKYLSFIDDLGQNNNSNTQQENAEAASLVLIDPVTSKASVISSDLQHFENIRNALINTKMCSIHMIPNDQQQQSSLTSIDDNLSHHQMVHSSHQNNNAEMLLANDGMFAVLSNNNNNNNNGTRSSSNNDMSINEDASIKELNEMSIKALKDECRRRNLLLKGNKNDLVERLMADMNTTNASNVTKPSSPSNVTTDSISFINSPMIQGEQQQQQIILNGNTALQLTQEQLEKLLAANPNIQIKLEYPTHNVLNNNSSVINAESHQPQTSQQLDPAIEHLQQIKKGYLQKMQIIEQQIQLHKSTQQQGPIQTQTQHQWQQNSAVELNKLEFSPNNSNKLRQASMPSNLNNFTILGGDNQPVYHQE